MRYMPRLAELGLGHTPFALRKNCDCMMAEMLKKPSPASAGA
jgi:hypothetical protein